jgi:hypothetical protein
MEKEENQEQEEIKNGTRLASLLNEAIESKVTEEMSRADIVQMMADAAGIDPRTVNGILNGDPDCPPLERLEGFAEVLDMSMSSIQSAAEEDGCAYGETEEEASAENKAEADCVECKKAKTEVEATQNKGLITSIKNLLGIGGSKKLEEANNKAKDSNDKLALALDELEAIRKENTTLKAKLQEASNEKKEAFDLLKQSENILSPIAKIKNRKGQTFQNVAELIQEYNALIAHNKELGGVDSNSGAPISDEETIVPIDKRQVSEEVDIKTQFAEIKKKVNKLKKKQQRK